MILKFDKHCEHECCIGLVYSYDYGIGHLLYNNETIKAKTTVKLFNFCPGCGQELNIKKFHYDESITFTKD